MMGQVDLAHGALAEQAAQAVLADLPRVENGAPQDLAERYGAGSDLLASVPAALAGFYRGLFTRTLTLHSPDAMQPVSHEYECSSPDVYRRYAMAIYPLRNQAGLLMVHTLRIESPIETRPGFIEGAPDGEYIAADGLVRQCACCRRTRSVRQPDQWHWIRDWVSRCPAMISHTVCAVCAVAYYPGLY